MTASPTACPLDSLPQRPGIPPSIRSLLNSGIRITYPGGQPHYALDPSWKPPALSAEQRLKLSKEHIEPIWAHLAPTDTRQVLATIKVLLRFFWIATGEPDEADKAMARLWADLLAPYPEWAIRKAVRQWLSLPGARRPLPGDLMAMMDSWLEEARLDLALLQRLVHAPETEATVP